MLRRVQVLIVVALAVATLFTVPVARAAEGLSVKLGNTGLTVGGLNPYGTAVVFSVGWPERSIIPAFAARTWNASDEDGNGEVELETGSPIPVRSIWAVIDQDNGQLSLTAPSGYELNQSPFPEDGMIQGEEGQPDMLALDSRFIEILVVRPGQAAWRYTCGDGGPRDEDQENDGTVTASLGSFMPYGSLTPPPTTFVAGDVVVAMSPYVMTVSATVVK